MSHPATASHLANVQYLRAIAAMMVVFGHAQHDAMVWAEKTGLAFTRSHLLPWGAGVDLFFVISGFIMVHASRGAFAMPGCQALFLRRRLIRIVPLYWLMSALYLATLVIQLRAIGKPLPTGGDIVAAFLFWPVDTFRDGFIRPFFTLGWTLNYEMAFYVCFAVALALPRAYAVAALAGFMAGLVALGAWLQPQGAALHFWSQAIVLEFVLGMAIAQAFLQGLRLPAWLRAAIVVAASSLLCRDFLDAASQPEGWITPNTLPRVLAWGLPAAMIVTAAVLGAKVQASPTAARRWGILLGDASYALYLAHPFVIVLVRKAMLATGLLASLGGWAMVAVSLAISCAIAIALHLWLEKPLTRWLTRRFAPQPPSALSPQLA